MECKSQTIYKHNTGLYICKGCFYYLPNLGCQQVGTHLKATETQRKTVSRRLTIHPLRCWGGCLFTVAQPYHKIKNRTTNRWELLITNHLNQLLRLANETQEEAIRSYLLHSSLVDVSLCCAFYQPHQTLQKCGQTGMCFIFLHPILQCRVIY